MKYLTLSSLLTTDEFFRGYSIYILILGPQKRFLDNTEGLDPIDPVVDSANRIRFDYRNLDVSNLKPTGYSSAEALIGERINKLRQNRTGYPLGNPRDFDFSFLQWDNFIEGAPVGSLKDNLEALSPYLLGNPLVDSA